MGHDNIDKEIKKKLEGRLLEPNVSAWEKLDNLLDKEESKSKNRMPFYWVAASIILLLGVFFIFQKGDSENNILVEPVIVEIEHDNVKNSIDEEQLEIDPLKQELEKQEKALEQTASVIVKQSHKTKKVKKLIKTKKEELPTAYEINELNLKAEEALLAESIEKKEKVKESTYDIDSEVDSLLAVAIASIDSEKKPTEVRTIIDANTLLADVEEELDMSFKEKVFKKIKLGFKKTKTAVAKRND